MTTLVAKPWGSETILTEPDLPYVLKILKINSGQKLSLQYHDLKLETLSLISGEAQIVWGSSIDNLVTETMVPEQGYTIKPGKIHRFIAITDTILIESSTGEGGTTYRLEDDTSRPNETDAIRNLPNRGWNNGQ